MEERFQYELNTDFRNSQIYPWVVVDRKDGGRIPMAYTVSQHTAMQYTRQLNEDGFISAV